MTRSDLLTLLQHNYWANARLLACAEQIAPEQLLAAADFDHQSAWQTLLHLVDCEWSWRLMAQRQAAAQMLWEVEDVADLAKLKAFWLRDEATMLAYIGGMDDAALNAEIEYGTPQGRAPQRAQLWQIIVHIIDHGAQHRSELARYFTVCGHSPGEFNFMDFLSAQKSIAQKNGD